MEHTIYYESKSEKFTGTNKISERVKYACDIILKNNSGHILDISINRHEITNILCEVARKYNRYVYTLHIPIPTNYYIVTENTNEDIIKNLEINELNSNKICFTLINIDENFSSTKLNEIIKASQDSIIKCNNMCIISPPYNNIAYDLKSIYNFTLLKSKYFREKYLFKKIPKEFIGFKYRENEYICTLNSEKYINTTILDEYTLDLFEKRYETVPYERMIIQNKHPDKYYLKEHINKSLIIHTKKDFDSKDFNIQMYTFGNTTETSFLHNSPCISI